MKDLIEIVARALVKQIGGEWETQTIFSRKAAIDNAQAALSALREAGALVEWRGIESAPSKGRVVLVSRLNEYSLKPIVEMAWHVPQFHEEDLSGDYDGAEEGPGNVYYIPAGWYVMLDDEIYCRLVTEPTHWAPLPKPPEEV